MRAGLYSDLRAVLEARAAAEQLTLTSWRARRRWPGVSAEQEERAAGTSRSHTRRLGMHVVERGAPVHYGGGAEAVYTHARLIRSVTHGHIHANGGLLTNVCMGVHGRQLALEPKPRQRPAVRPVLVARPSGDWCNYLLRIRDQRCGLWRKEMHVLG